MATGNTYRPIGVLKKYSANITPNKTIGLKIAIHFGNAVFPERINLIHNTDTTNIATRNTLTKGSLCSENSANKSPRSLPAAISCTVDAMKKRWLIQAVPIANAYAPIKKNARACFGPAGSSFFDKNQ